MRRAVDDKGLAAAGRLRWLLLALAVGAGLAIPRAGRAADPATGAAPAPPSLALVSPFKLGAVDLANLPLAALLPHLATAAATGLAADGVSAAIAVYGTGSAEAVTFTTSNGTDVLPYAAGFLARPPAAGHATLSLTPQKIGSAFYAAALIQAPREGSAPDYATAVLVTARQGSNTATRALKLVPPPVALVHGLWGDASSLAQTELYLRLHAPWRGAAKVQPLCYSPYLAFDATSDPLKRTGCEVTSADALRTTINALLATLDDQGVVGGRVDVVAHSMGGLAARNYASLSGYRSLRNRGQGDLHEIVTLNTPETGSLLAPFLLSVGHATRVASLLSVPGALWASQCGLSSSTTVATCFAGLGMPLAGPGLSWCTGSVYSLFPVGSRFAGCVNLPSLTNPHLAAPGATAGAWRAVSSLAPGNSAPEAAINELIAAVAADQAAPPTIDSILDHLPNDSIVALPSQLAGAPASHFTTFTGLSHTSLPAVWDLLINEFGYDNASVVADPSGEVDRLVGCWLQHGGSASDRACLPRPAAIAVASPARPFAGLRLVPRIAIAQPGALRLATASALPVRLLEARPITAVQISQRDGSNHHVTQAATIDRIVGDIAYVTVVPALPGRVTFTVSVRFADGGLAVDRASAEVALPTAAPETFQADAAARVVLNLGFPGNDYVLRPYARFAGLADPVALDGASVTYRLIGDGAASVRLSASGRIEAVAPGTATIEARLGAVTAAVGVTVLATKP